MHRYVLVSGLFLILLTFVQLLRLILGWRVTVAGVEIPLWASAVAALIAGSLAIWAFRVRGRIGSSSAV
jgi:lipopolysaccharide export LptBFGC system permease protein LptF